MRKYYKLTALLLTSLLLLTGCLGQDNNEPEEVIEIPAPTQEQAESPETTSTVTTPTGTVVEPTTSVERVSAVLPVLFEYQLKNFDLEFFYQDEKFIYEGFYEVPNTCYEISKLVSVSDSKPEHVIIDLETVFVGEDCAEERVQKSISGTVDASSNATFTIYMNDIKAVKYFPTPTPTPAL